MSSHRLKIYCFTLILINVCIQVIEARPRMRHDRGGDLRCSRCGPGWGVMKLCDPNHETECEKCQHGSYSPHHNFQPCWICSRCGPGLYEAHPCTSKTDTVCDSCHRQVPNNADYKKKCQHYKKTLFLAPEDAKSTGEQSSLVNEEANNSFNEEEREKILEEDIQEEFFEASKLNMKRL